MKWVVSVIVLLLTMIPPPMRGQGRGPNPYDNVNYCIDKCYGSCSSYPVGSSGKQACVDQCIKYTCQAKYTNIWGAIAYSRKEKAAGWAYEQSDQSSANSLAMQNCRKQGGARCEIVTSFSKTCASLAADGEVIGWATAGNKDAAQQQALGQCAKSGGRKCEIQAWSCSAPSAGGEASKPSTPAPPKNPNAPSWGAIAYSPRDFGAGWSQGKPDRASAEQEAMAKCAQRGKACVLQNAFNKLCGALVADGSAIGVGTAPDPKEALQKATDQCKNAGGRQCSPHISFCSF